MKHLKTYEALFQYQDVYDIETQHTPGFDIIKVSAKVGVKNETSVSYEIHVDGALKGQEFFNSYYKANQVPLKYKIVFEQLRKYVRENFPMYFSDKIMSANKKTGIFESKFTKLSDRELQLMIIQILQKTLKEYSAIISKKLTFGGIVKEIENINASIFIEYKSFNKLLNELVEKNILLKEVENRIDYYQLNPKFIDIDRYILFSQKLINTNNKTGIFE